MLVLGWVTHHSPSTTHTLGSILFDGRIIYTWVSVGDKVIFEVKRGRVVLVHGWVTTFYICCNCC